MKTTKLVLLAAIMAIATTGFTQPESAPACAEKPAPTLSVKTTVKIAMQNPMLWHEMHLQLTPAFLMNEQPCYTQTVQVKNVVYSITGTYKEWKLFFSIKPAPDQPKK